MQVKIIFSDNEGCLIPGKGLPFDNSALHALQGKLEELSNIGFSLCTGRSVPYVEAMTQALGLSRSSVPCVCEGGSVIYSPATDRWESLAEPVDRAMIIKLLDGLHYREEVGKKVCFSVYPEPGTTVADIYARLLESDLPQVTITKSIAAVDLTPHGVDKAFGLRKVCERLGIPLNQVAAIGDSWNDLPMLRLAGFSACPKNAVAEVKDVVDYVSPYESTLGVLDFLHHIS
ncbi:MAG TPA: HAD family hydrolase [Blastocatellia bacterium]|jgi:hypothetical protein|nr:HAD family hydrolase [Blastocatellia bacterium]